MNQHPWDERVGPDASLVRVGGGKRKGEKAELQSQLPLQPKGSPFLVEMPRHFPNDPVRVDPDLHLWRSYRSIVHGDDSRVEGKKMVHSHVLPVAEVQDKLRQGLRDRLRMHEIKELALKEQHQRERKDMSVRHESRDKMIDVAFRKRAAERGFEGLRKPVLKQPEADPNVPDEAVNKLRDSLLQNCIYRSAGKKMVVGEHASQLDHGPLFGGSGVNYDDPSHRRWVSKSFT